VRVAAALAAAPLVVAALTSSLRVREPPAPLAAAAETVVFVVLPDGIGLLRGPAARASRVACAAGADASPGGRPVLDDEDPPVDVEPEEKLPRGKESIPMQMDRVEKKTKWLKSLKGKFVPYGPKPWDAKRFMKVHIQTRLEVKQASNTKIINQVVEEIRRISGRHPYVVKAKTNIAKYGWRVGMDCGVSVTIYGKLMNDFLSRLNTIVLPRVRDFEGLYPNSFDNQGNFFMSFENQEPFKELDELLDTRELTHHFDVAILNNCLTQPDGLQLMKDYGFPFGDPRPPRNKVSLAPWQKTLKGRKKKASKKRR